MLFFEWSQDLSVGHPLLDREHQMLIALVNELHGSRGQDGGPQTAALILQRLMAYTEEHFAREEAHMQAIAYPYLAGHRAEHVALVGAVRDLCVHQAGGDSTRTARIALLLRDWLSVHIMCWDKDIARRRGPVPGGAPG